MENEEKELLEVDLVSPQEGKEITEEVSEDAFENVFTKEKYKSEKEVVGSYDALNGNFMIIDDIRSDFGRMSNPTEIMTLQKELKSLEDEGRPSEEFLKLARQVDEIANENAEDSQAQILALEEDNKELVEARRKQIDKVTTLMEDEMSVDLLIIHETILPEDITAKQISNLEKIIK